MKINRAFLTVAVAIALLSSARAARATEYHVAVTGNDGNNGTATAPFRNIQKAADVMQPGDVCTVHAGLYREWVKPARGGTSETARIVYRAATGEAVYISGAERVTSWTQEGSVWKAVLPNAMFGTFNPYSTNISGDYLTFGGDKHLGAVYLGDELYKEALTEGEVTGTAGLWRAVVDASNTTIWANFGAHNPNNETAEVNVRRYVFAPTVTRLKYITLEGFHIRQAATNWAPPTKPQDGMVMPNWGLRWIIQNNELSDSRAVCLISGNGTSGGPGGADQTGNHIIRNNHIHRCGQAGIAGENGLVASLIERNLIEDTNPLRDFGGWEGAGIKIHQAVDVVIRNNVIRRIHAGPSGAQLGIWIDWAGQGNRITGNVFYEIDHTALEFEMDHGPNLVDNNIFLGSLADIADNSIYVHNLFLGQGLGVNGGDGRMPYWFAPHTFTRAGTSLLMTVDNKYFNNIHAGGGTGGVPMRPGFASDYSVYYGGASKTSWADSHSLSSSFAPGVSVSSLPNGVTVTWKTDSAPTDVACPLITRDFIGPGSITKQGIENHDGTPITVDRDILGNARSATRPTAGPLEGGAGDHTVTLLAGPTAPLPGTGGTGTGGSGGTGGTGGTGGATGGAAGADAGAGGADGGADARSPDGGADAGKLDAGKLDGGTGGTSGGGTGGSSGGGTGGASGGGTGGSSGGGAGASGTGGLTGGQGGTSGAGGFGPQPDDTGGTTGTRKRASQGGCAFSPGGDGGAGLLLGLAALARRASASWRRRRRPASRPCDP